MRRVFFFASVISFAACNEEPQLAGGKCEGECWAVDPSTPLDAGDVPRDAGRWVLLEDGGERDGGADRDGGVSMFGDAGVPIDAGTPIDAGAADAGFPLDASPNAPVTPGTYSFTPAAAPLPPNAELTHVAISPDGTTMILSERYDRLHVVALPAETLVRTVVLPRVRSEDLNISGIRYTSPTTVVVAATAHEGAATSGRVFTMGAAGEQVAGGSMIPSVRFGSIETHPTTPGAVQVIGQSSDGAWTRFYRVEPTSTSPLFEGQAPISAGCQDVAPALDAIGNPVGVYACGENGGAIGTFDGATFFSGPAVVNTSRVASRPQRDYALFVTWSNGRLSRYARGQYTVGSSAPALGSLDLFDITFNDDGTRALITGELTGSVAQMREYRHGAYTSAGLVDVSIQNFDAPPFYGRNGVVLWESAWRPGTDCGYVVGGCGTGVCQRGYLLAFSVAGGRACP